MCKPPNYKLEEHQYPIINVVVQTKDEQGHQM